MPLFVYFSAYHIIYDIFNYCLILLGYSLIDSVLFLSPLFAAPEITYSCWFVIIFIFMVKKVPNISNYFVFDFILFFQSKKVSFFFNCSVIYLFFYSKKICYIYFFFFCLKRFLTSLIVVSSISLYSSKRFFTSLIMMSSIFLTFSGHELFIIIRCEKKLINFFFKKSFLYSLEKAFENTIFKLIQKIL